MVDFFAPAPADSPVDSSLLFRILPPFNTKAESPDMIYKATWLTLRTSVSWSPNVWADCFNTSEEVLRKMAIKFGLDRFETFYGKSLRS